MNYNFTYEISCLVCEYRLVITSKEFNREQRKKTKNKPRFEQAIRDHGEIRYRNGMANGFCHENNLAYRSGLNVFPISLKS